MDQFRQRFELFCFFHLGSDAHLCYHETEQGLKISVSHRRVEPFAFEISWPELAALLQRREAFEDYLLDQLTPHRR